MTINDLQHREDVTIRTASKENKWSDWFTCSLFVQRNTKNEVVLFTPIEVVWAEYTPRDVNRDDEHGLIFENGGHFMQIKDLHKA